MSQGSLHTTSLGRAITMLHYSAQALSTAIDTARLPPRVASKQPQNVVSQLFKITLLVV